MASGTSTKLTYDDYVLLPNDGRRYEILDGELYVNPAPNTKHQRVVLNLALALATFVRTNRLGEVFVAPYDVVLSDIDVVEPDLMFIGNARMVIITEANAQGSPDLVIEVLSEGTRRYDETVKMKRYERFGVAEYWLINPDDRTVKVYRQTNAKLTAVAVGDPTTSPLLPGFSLPMSELFSYAP